MRIETLEEAVASARTSWARTKRAERERAREGGRPETGVLDRAVVEALRETILATPPGQRLGREIVVEKLVRAVGALLLRRVHEAHEAGAEPLGYTKEGVAAAIEDRLFRPAKRTARPSKAP
jgi:hypothetical protein